MAKIPEVNKKGFFTPNTAEEPTEEMIQRFEHDNEEYEIIYKSMDPNTNKMVVVKPDVAKAVIKDFIQNEIGGYIDGEFKLINQHISSKFDDIRQKLISHVESKIDILAEEIVTEMTSTNFKTAVEKKVSEKLAKLKGLLDE